VALFLAAPAVWAVQTLGHGTTGPFPAGGPASQSFFGGGPRGGGPPGGAAAGPGPIGNGSSLTAALSYAKTHGGGTIAVSSQSSAATAVLSSDARVAGIGGFSGRESQVTARWLASAVSSGKVRWVLTDNQGGFQAPADGRIGAKTAMSVVSSTCKSVSSVSGLYDCSGQAAALRAA
jgi:hypothetical protein